MIKSKGEKVFDVCNIILMVLFTCAFVFPVIIIVSASFTSTEGLTKYGYSLFIHGFSLGSYKYIFTASDLFLRSMLNSLIITVSATALLVVTTSLYAYALTRKELQFRKFFTVLLLIPILFAGGTIPYYININNLGLMNSPLAIILPGAVNAWYILLVRNFFRNLPESLSEAAKIEGANNMQVLFRVTLPLGFPIIATIILYSAVALWNDWFQAMLFLDSSHKQLWPVQAVVRELNTNFSSIANAVGGGSTLGLNSEGIKSAAVVISTLPIVIIYPFLQRFFINGVLVGGVKE